MAEKKTRRKFAPEQKAAILCRHLKDKVPVSDLCDEYRIQPSMFYEWQRLAFENLTAALDSGRPGLGQNIERERHKREVEGLRAKLARKDSVIAEISEEYVQLKKEFGGP